MVPLIGRALLLCLQIASYDQLARFPVVANARPAAVVANAPAPQFTFPGWAGSAGDDESDGGPPLRGPSSLLGYSQGELSDKGDSAVVPTASYSLVPGQTDAADIGVPFSFEDAENPQPIRGDLGTTDPGPRTYAYDRLNPDLLAPPGSDSGELPNGKWPMGLSHNRILPGNAGWARQQNVQQLPVATAMAGVDMRLAPNAYRELHWHTANEWAYIFNGTVRVTAFDPDGRTFVDDLQPGDVWFFPSGQPHSLQALDQGVEFLLIFDDGNFSDGGTGLITEMFLRTPREVLAKNLDAPLSAFDDIPKDQLYIFNGTPAPTNISAQNVTTGPGGVATGNASYTYHLSQQEAYETPGGSIKILDPATFPIASGFSVALVTVKPGAMRELHWHLTSDEWTFFISGNARVTIYSPPSSSATYDFAAGDVGYIPAADSHYVENTGDTDVVFLEVLQASRFTDISVGQWLKLTPRQIIKDTLRLSDDLLDNLSVNKQYVIAGNPDLTDISS